MTRDIRFRPVAVRLTGAVWLALGLNWGASVAFADDRPWLDRSRATDERAQLIVRQMTLEEKSALLYGYGTREIGGYEQLNSWVVDKGIYMISIGPSSVDRPLSVDVEAKVGPETSK